MRSKFQRRLFFILADGVVVQQGQDCTDVRDLHIGAIKDGLGKSIESFVIDDGMVYPVEGFDAYGQPVLAKGHLPRTEDERSIAGIQGSPAFSMHY